MVSVYSQIAAGDFRNYISLYTFGMEHTWLFFLRDESGLAVIINN